MLNSSKSMMKYQYDLNKKLADENRNWQEQMANSAHQREIADLKKAGLNPVLTLTGGSGANTPTGSTASVNDGAGYASALANLEAARLNSASQLESTRLNTATQMLMHTTPGANTTLGQVEYLADKVGVDIGEFFSKIGDSIGISVNNTNENTARGKYIKRTNHAFDSIELSMSSLSTDIAFARLSGKDRKAKRLQKKLDRLKYYYPKQWKNVRNENVSVSRNNDYYGKKWRKR